MKYVLSLTLLLGGLAFAAHAQYPGSRGYDIRDRAYRHFLNSKSRLRTFSTGEPGYTVEDFTPFDYRRFSREGTYERHRIDRFGYSEYRRILGYQFEEESPFYYRYESVPSQGYYRFVPHRFLYRR